MQCSPCLQSSDTLISCVNGFAGYVPSGNKYKDLPTIRLQVNSDLVSLLITQDADSSHCQGQEGSPQIAASQACKVIDVHLTFKELFTRLNREQCNMTKALTTHTSLQHDNNEYGAEIAADGEHTGGPFFIDVSPSMRIEDLRLVIQVTTCITLKEVWFASIKQMPGQSSRLFATMQDH